MLEVQNLKRQYQGYDGRPGGGVLGASFVIPQGELFTLLGPSGCGKTTTLRAVAGLETPDEGRIVLAGRELFDHRSRANVALYDRDIGMVFQSYAIWPHMTVFENAAYPLRVSRTRKFSQSEIERKTGAVLEMVGLAAFAKRSATQLSGGQQQRLALARAFTREPRLLLLDEPLSNLDALLRDQMRVELKRLQRETGVTAIYVTHDQSEALAISDRIAVMNNGLIVQVGTPKEIYGRPQSEFVANFIGRTNLLRGTLMEDAAKDALASVKTAIGALRCLFPTARAKGCDATIVVRPEHIVIGHPASMDANIVNGTITRESFLGEIFEYLVNVEGGELLVRTQNMLDSAAGETVTVSFACEKSIALQLAHTGASR